MGLRGRLARSNLVCAAAHQFGMSQGYAGKTKRGAPIPWGDIPPRPFLGVSEEDGDRILDILRDYLHAYLHQAV